MQAPHRGPVQDDDRERHGTVDGTDGHEHRHGHARGYKRQAEQQAQTGQHADENHRADRYSRIRDPFLREALHRIQLHAGQPEPLSLRHRLHPRPGLVRRFLFAHPATQPLEPALGVE
ncbi:MAG TPA: hypothetical protein VE888_09215 [Streptosporangiaceae bacterium]|nr:hypothetical protein [Streptosporangiaceae bacterium]